MYNRIHWKKRHTNAIEHAIIFLHASTAEPNFKYL